MSDLRALAERLEKATGNEDADEKRELNMAIASIAVDFGEDRLRAYVSSIDAAVALCERVLPGWEWSVMSGRAFVWPKGEGQYVSSRLQSESAPTPALALCLAVVRAKLAEAE